MENKIIRNLLILVLSLIGVSANAQKFQYGIGANLGATLSHPEKGANISSQLRPGLGISGILKYQFQNNFGLISGLSYTRNSVFIRHKDFNFPNLSNNNRVVFGASNATFKIPINLTYVFEVNDKRFIDVQVGASFAYAMTTVLTTSSSFNGDYSGTDTFKFKVNSNDNFTRQMGFELNFAINYYKNSVKKPGRMHRYSIGFDHALFNAYRFNYQIELENSNTKVIHNISEAVNYSYFKIEYAYFFTGKKTQTNTRNLGL